MSSFLSSHICRYITTYIYHDVLISHFLSLSLSLDAVFIGTLRLSLSRHSPKVVVVHRLEFPLSLSLSLSLSLIISLSLSLSLDAVFVGTLRLSLSRHSPKVVVVNGFKVP